MGDRLISLIVYDPMRRLLNAKFYKYYSENVTTDITAYSAFQLAITQITVWRHVATQVFCSLT